MRQSTEPTLMAATCSVLYVALERLKMRIFWEITSRVISAFLLDSATCMASVHEFCGISRIFYVKVFSGRLFSVHPCLCR